MESNKKYVIGLDFGTDSCRALVKKQRNIGIVPIQVMS